MCIYISLSLYIYIYIIYIYVYVYIHICIYLSIYLYIYRSIYLSLSLSIYIYIYIYICAGGGHPVATLTRSLIHTTPWAPYEKSKSSGSWGGMVARLKLKGIDGRAPPGAGPQGAAL